MTINRPSGAIVLAAAGFLLVCAPSATPQNDAVRVLVSNGMKGAMEELKPQCERAIGHPVELQFNSTASVKKSIEAGARFDVSIITTEAIADLIRQGKLVGRSKADLCRSELGIGIRAGAPKPDIRTPESLKRALLAAKSITYPQDGATRGYIETMFEHMGIAAELKPRIILAPGSGPATESVASGNAAMVITLFSEIVPVHGVEILGPLPGDLHYDIRFAAAAGTGAKNLEAAQALIAFMAGPKVASTLKAKGLER